MVEVHGDEYQLRILFLAEVDFLEFGGSITCRADRVVVHCNCQQMGKGDMLFGRRQSLLLLLNCVV